MIDKLYLHMSKIESSDATANKLNSLSDKGSESGNKRTQSTDLAAEVGNVSLDTRAGSSSRSAGPSLLSQQAAATVTSSSTRPVPVPQPPTPEQTGDVDGVPSSVMSVDRQSTTETTSSGLDGTERITVKIADLGNGTVLFIDLLSLTIFSCAPVQTLSIDLFSPFVLYQPLGLNITSLMISRRGSIGARR